MTSATNTVEFEARNDAEGTAQLNRLCNDGRCWLVSAGFTKARATAFARERFPRDSVLAARRTGFKFWRSGAWHPINPDAVAKAERRDWADADKAAGVSDGGGPRTRREAYGWLANHLRKTSR